MTGCGCGGGCQGTCGGDGGHAGAVGGYTRPRFFAGQLLTEDDLQGLSDYVAAKNRLHNRYLFGEGVACGLEVRCHDGGRVLVGSGYALDCCGNDIVVPCDVLVDVNELVGELVDGGDCTDPCPPPEAPAGAPVRAHPTVANLPPLPGSREPAVKPVHRTPGRHYQLVIEYAEIPAEPLMPYSTGDEWSSAQCEPSRLRESYQISLRCETSGAKRVDVWTRLLACIGSLDEVRKQLDVLRRAARVAERLRVVDPCKTPGEPVEMSAESFREHASELTGDIDADGFRTWLDGLITLAAEWVTRASDPNGVADAAGAREELITTVKLAVDHVEQYPHLLDDVSEAVLDALDELATSTRYAAIGTPDALGEPLTPVYDDRLLQQCQPASDRLRSFLAASLRGVHEWLLCRAERVPALHCTTLAKLRVLDVDPTSGPSLASAAASLRHAARTILLDCVCAALNPPCPPCDDAAVVLATVVVRDCVVVEVCNAARHHLLTGPNIEYWLPPIGMLHDQLQRWCCAPLEIEREDHLCAEEPCRADVFAALGTGNALNAIGIDTAALDRSLRARAGRVWRQVGSVADLERWADLVSTSAPAMPTEPAGMVPAGAAVTPAPAPPAATAGPNAQAAVAAPSSPPTPAAATSATAAKKSVAPVSATAPASTRGGGGRAPSGSQNRSGRNA